MQCTSKNENVDGNEASRDKLKQKEISFKACRKKISYDTQALAYLHKKRYKITTTKTKTQGQNEAQRKDQKETYKGKKFSKPYNLFAKKTIKENTI